MRGRSQRPPSAAAALGVPGGVARAARARDAARSSSTLPALAGGARRPAGRAVQRPARRRGAHDARRAWRRSVDARSRSSGRRRTCLLGDFLDSTGARPAVARACATWPRELARLAARRSPCSATTTGARPARRWAGRCATPGVPVLENEARAGRRRPVGGRASATTGIRAREPRRRAARRCPRTPPCCCCTHDPDVFPRRPGARRADRRRAHCTAARSTSRSCAARSCPSRYGERYLARPRGRGRPAPLRVVRPRHAGCRCACGARPRSSVLTLRAPRLQQRVDVLVGQADRRVGRRPAASGPGGSAAHASQVASWASSIQATGGRGPAQASIAASFQWRGRAAARAAKRQVRPAAGQPEQAREVLLGAVLPARAPDALERAGAAASAACPARPESKCGMPSTVVAAGRQEVRLSKPKREMTPSTSIKQEGRVQDFIAVSVDVSLMRRPQGGGLGYRCRSSRTRVAPGARRSVRPSRRGRRLTRFIMTLNLGILLALGCAVATQLGFLYKHRGANEAPRVDVRHPLRSGRALFRSKWFAIGMADRRRRLAAATSPRSPSRRCRSSRRCSPPAS